MTDSIRYPLVLGLISLCSAAGLAVSYTLTRDEIRRQQVLKRNRGLAAVFGIAFDETSDAPPPWKALGEAAEKQHGVVYRAEDPKTGRRLFATGGRAQGYSSKVSVIVAVDEAIAKTPRQAKVQAIKVVGQLETPGLGSRCADEAFQRQFRELPLGKLEVAKNAKYRVPENDVEGEQGIAAITGATITTNAVIGAVREALERIRERAREHREPTDHSQAP